MRSKLILAGSKERVVCLTRVFFLQMVAGAGWEEVRKGEQRVQ